ncbi:coiled-coil domain-containing protein SCD2-like [Heracleum sosnowskyi]|uniref:Coiled-coil domain-containing protein SCD2-like n=1 Tax=Heracleum sosnowskyi TaxID=360622 RepID=A0AAD8GP10_9APIA|nr:coiled-coil domain-containing protein SCD2-like [Heracleum sosnowskyi]
MTLSDGPSSKSLKRATEKLTLYSPTSPMHRHARSSSGISRKPNTKAAAQRLAQVMSNQSGGGGDESDEEDDLDLLDYNPSNASTIGLGAGGRAARPRSPMAVRASAAEHTSPMRPLAGSRRPVNSGHHQSLSGSRTPQPLNVAEQQSASLENIRASKPVNKVDHQPPSHRSLRVQVPQSVSVETQSVDDWDEEVSPLAISQAPQAFKKQASPVRSYSPSRPSRPHSMDQSQLSRTSLLSQSSQAPTSGEQEQHLSARSGSGVRASASSASLEQPLSARSPLSIRPSSGFKTAHIIPSSVSISLGPHHSGIPGENQPESRKDKRFSVDLGSMNHIESGNQSPASVLQDELDSLQEENESLLQKLRFVEERIEESEVRARQLEKQVVGLGEGVSMEARLLSRKEAALQQREDALKGVQQTYGTEGTGNEVELLRIEAESAREAATSAFEQLKYVAYEVNSLRTMTQRSMLTQEEMEEVVLKRCWLARYWSLCTKLGLHSELAAARYEYWSSFAPLPDEVVIAAGQMAKDEDSLENNDLNERGKIPNDMNDFLGDANIENMLSVEKGLRELNSLKIENSLAIALAQQRPRDPQKSCLKVEVELPEEGKDFTETLKLSEEELNDVHFKQAWLAYFWRRAKNHGLEPDIAEERLAYWINQDMEEPTSQDAVDVERGLMELRKLGIETQLWEESRKIIDPEPKMKLQMESSF